MAEFELFAQRVGRSRQFGSSHIIPAINNCKQPVALNVDDEASENMPGNDLEVGHAAVGHLEVGHVEVGHLAAGHLESDLAEDPIPPPVTSVQLEKNSRECYNERVRKDREVRAAVCDGGLWNCNGVAGKEGQIEDFISSKNLGFIVLVEPKQSAASWLASKSTEELELFNWQICSKCRRTGEAGGGVWIVAPQQTDMIPVLHDTSPPGKEDDDSEYERQEIAAAFIRPEGAEEWSAVIGIYVTNSQKKSHYRTATLNNILKTRRRMKEKARDDGLKIREMLFLGDLNMRLSKSERRKLEYQDEEASDSDDEADDNISWNDHTEKGTYSKNEMRIVKSWLNDGMRIVNGRTPYDEGAATRGFSILDCVLSDHIEKIIKIERDGGSSDHQLLVIRSKPRKTWTSLGRARTAKKTKDELSISDVNFEAWSETEANRYNDILSEMLGKHHLLDELTCNSQGNELEKHLRESILISAVVTEAERLDRMKGTGIDGNETENPIYQHQKTIKNKRLEALGAYEKNPTAENLELLRTAKKEWKDELKSSMKKRKGANFQW